MDGEFAVYAEEKGGENMVSTTPHKAYELYKWAKSELENGNRVKASKIHQAFENTMQKMSDYDRWRTENMMKIYERQMFLNEIGRQLTEQYAMAERLRIDTMLAQEKTGR